MTGDNLRPGAHSDAERAARQLHTGHSPDTEPLSWGFRYLMCPPSHFRVSYSINAWMNTNAPVDIGLADEQWDRLASLLRGAGAVIEQIAQVESLPDMVFTANAGLVDGARFIPAAMGPAERRAETEHFQAWFSARGYQVANQRVGAVQEGAGDALPFNGTLIAGHGQRSTEFSCHALAADAGLRVLTARLVDPRFYHFDIAFCPLDERSALFAPGAFDQAGRRVIAQIVPDPVELTPEETTAFCANSVVVGRTIIMPDCTPRLECLLTQRGFEVAVCNVSEFLKAGGGCRCLTLPLDTVLTAHSDLAPAALG
jgi:N-dimethylarginine dimethylaminohydrolase